MEIRQVEKISDWPTQNDGSCGLGNDEERCSEERPLRQVERPMMAAAIDTGLDFFRQVLSLRAYRQEVLSADIANASTPGFKAIDLDFASALDTATKRRTGSDAPAATPPKRVWLIDNARQINLSAKDDESPAAAYIKYQAGTEVTLDGNSVDLDREKVNAAANAVQYEAATTFASQTIRMLMIAITGSASSQSSGS
jgi:flagellar basal-body rod protein FlgB